MNRITNLDLRWAVLGALAFVWLPFTARAAQAPAYTISTVAGQGGMAGSTGNEGAPTSAQLNGPFGLTLDSSANLYISDQNNNTVREISGATINAFAGNGTAGYSGDGAAATAGEIDTPWGLAVDSSNNVYIADWANSVVRKVSGGNISTIAGSFAGGAGYGGDGGPATAALLNSPSGIAVDSAGNVYIADAGNNLVRVICANTTPLVCAGTTAGTIMTFAGNQTPGYAGDGAAATAAELNDPNAVALDSNGNLYIVDTGNNVIREVTPQGVISTVAGNTVAAFSGDGGPALQASLNVPRGIAVDGSGNLYVADTANNAVRLVQASSGNIYTIAGTTAAGFSGDGGPAASAMLQFPTSVVLSSGNIYVADYGNDVVRLLTAGGTNPNPIINNGGVITAGSFGAFASAAPGTWIEIYGSQLATTTRGWTGADFSGANGPTTLSGTSVTIGGFPAVIDYISPGQVNAQVPFSVGNGAQPLVLTSGSNISVPYSLDINVSSAGLLAPAVLDVSGNQYAGALYPNTLTFVAPTGAVNGITSQPASPGDNIVFYGVGFGQVTPAVNSGVIVPGQNMLVDPFQIFIGNAPATMTYQGLAPGEIGLYQFNVVVPTVAAGNLVPVTFMLNGTNSTQTLYIAIGN